MRIALAQVNPTIGDFAGNFAPHHEAIDRAKAAGCDLVVFPELATTGYPPRDLLEERWFVQREPRRPQAPGRGDRRHRRRSWATSSARRVRRRGRRLHNAPRLFEDGRILARARKSLLPTYDVFDETRYFEPGRRRDGRRGSPAPRLGLTICEDIWNDEIFGRPPLPPRPRRAAGPRRAPTLLVNISASPFTLGKRERRHDLLGAGRPPPRPARRLRATRSAATTSWSSTATRWSSTPAAAASPGRAAFAEDLVVVDLETRRRASATPSRPSPDEEARSTALRSACATTSASAASASAVLGLSGGIDSALVAAPGRARRSARRTCSACPCPRRYTSARPIEDAAAAGRATSASASHDRPHRAASTRPYLEARWRRPSRDAPPTLTEENIQARIRGNILMALLEQVRPPAALHRQQERAGGRLLHALRRHGRRPGGHRATCPRRWSTRWRAHAQPRSGEVIPRAVAHASRRRPSCGRTRPTRTRCRPTTCSTPSCKLYVEERLSPAEIAERGLRPRAWSRRSWPGCTATSTSAGRPPRASR